MIETPIEFLESKRLGLKHREFDELFSINSTYMDEELQYSSTFKHKVITEKKQNLEDYSDELNIAYTHEYGYTFDAMISVVTGLINYSRKIGERDVYVDNKQDLINQLYLDNAYCSEEVIEKIINDLSLTQRDDFLNPDKPYRKEDVYPWRFNRELSLFRKPLICRGKEIIWGERVVGHYIGYIYELLMSGKFRTHTQELNVLLGKISDDRGRNFNNRIFCLLNKFDEFFVFKNVKEVNGLQIADKNGNELGDIDILIIDEKYSSIVAAEVKDFKMSKNPYEMNLEFEKMFVNKEKNTCYATKHQKRVNWIVEHLTDFIKAYELKEAKWDIYGLFIVNHPIISNKLHGEKITIISEAELSVDSIRRVYGT